MIKANRMTSFEKIFHLYNQRLLKKSFHQIKITKDSFIPTSNNGIYLINHSSWWDSLVLFYLNQTFLKLDSIAMMGKDGLRRFPFFSKLGAFSIDTESRHSLLESLQYSSKQLEKNKHLFLFPQGLETHLDKRPLLFFSGASYLHEKNPSVPIIPIVFYHGLFHHQLPDWYIHIGHPLSIPKEVRRKDKTHYLEQEMEIFLNTLKTRIMADDDQLFNVLLEGKKGIGDNWETFKKSIRREKL